MGPEDFRIGNYVNGGIVEKIEIDQLVIRGCYGKIPGATGLLYKYVKPELITPDELIRMGFERKPETTWYGNGHDHPQQEDLATSKTIQHDYVKDDKYVIRYERFRWRKNTGSEWNSDPEYMSVHIVRDGWYPKCYEPVPCSQEKKFLHELQNLFWELERIELKRNFK